MDKKPTDNEIIKALECCFDNGAGCDKCPIRKECYNGDIDFKKETLDLINRLQAENERLRSEVETTRNYIHDNNLEYDLLSYSKIKTNDWLIKGISKKQLEQEKIQVYKAEAYKEFAGKLERKLLRYRLTDAGAEMLQIIHNLLKEMVGDI